MKKLFCLVTCLCLILCFTLSNTSVSFANSSNNIPERQLLCQYEKVIDNIEYIISVYENDENLQDRVARRVECDNKKKLSLEGLKFLLTELGTDEESFAALSDKTIDSFKQSSEFGSTIKYLKYYESNEVVIPITEGRSTEALSDIQDNPYEDSYMRIQLLWDRNYGSDRYTFTEIARWLNMPSIRQTDIIGIATTNLALDNIDDAICYYYYTQTVNYGGQVSSNTVFQNVTTLTAVDNNAWYGLGARVHLPQDSYDSVYDTDITNNNFTAYFECEMRVPYPEHILNFNAIGCYTHSKVVILPSFALALGSGSNLGFSFSAVMQSLQDVRNALALITYLP